MSLLVVAVEILACFGYGAVAIRMFGVGESLTRHERFALAFAVGLGLIGWLLFFLGWGGHFHRAVFAAVLAVGMIGLFALRRDIVTVGALRTAWPDWFLLVAIVFVASGDVLEALAPPADADTLAYHYALPKQFIAAGVLEFVPLAIDGAMPLLVQMTYIPALALGGERALTLWCMATGWAAAWVFYVVLRRYVRPRVAGAGALILMSTPVVLAGAGTGQIEVRIVLFTLAAAVFAADYVRTGYYRSAALAGAMAGFYAASKYLGLLYLAAIGLTVLVQRRDLRGLVALPAGAVLAGFQWYLWNWLNTGDPVFPMLTGRFGFGDPTLWSADFNAWFEANAMAGESPLPRTILWFFLYPFYEIFVGFPEFGGGRVGLGPVLVLVLPFALGAAWHWRRRLADSPILTFALLASSFYVIWFFANPSLRVRHLLPVYAIFLVVIIVAAERFADRFRVEKLLAGAIGIAVVIQIGGQALYAANYFRFTMLGETRERFLARNVSAYSPVPWINENLKSDDRILVETRQVIYLIDVPTFFGHPYTQSLVDLRPDKLSPNQLMESLRRNKITHVLARAEPSAPQKGQFVALEPWQSMTERSCLELLERFSDIGIVSRTMNIDGPNEGSAVFKLKQDCR